MSQTSKKQLRAQYLSRRLALAPDQRERESLKIANQLISLDIWGLQYFHLFLPMTKKAEPQTDFIMHILHGRDKSIVLSKANFDNHSLQHYLLEDHTKIIDSAYGIPEPVEGILIQPQQLDVVFVPLLSFDQSGYRLGYGKGFYDQFLRSCRHDCLKIGIGFFGPDPELPHDSWDIPLDMAVTPDVVYRF